MRYTLAILGLSLLFAWTSSAARLGHFQARLEGATVLDPTGALEKLRKEYAHRFTLAFAAERLTS